MTWPILLLIGILVVLYGVLHYFFEGLRPTLHAVGVGVLALAAIAQWYATNEQASVATDQLRLSASRADQQVQHSRVATAFDYIREWESPERQRILAMAGAIADTAHGRSAEEFDRWLEDQPDDTERELIRALNYLERLGLAVTSDYAHGATLCKHLGPGFISFYDGLESWIEYERETEGPRDVWVQLDSLYVRWRSGCPQS